MSDDSVHPDVDANAVRVFTTDDAAVLPLPPDLGANAVRVFTTDDAAVLALASMALENEGIEYQVKHAAKADSMNWLMGQPPTTRPVVLDIFVAPDVAARAKELLSDLSS